MNIKKQIWFAIHTHRRNRLVARLVRLCKNIHRASEHPGYDVGQNGEKSVLASSITGQSPVIFDVGANVGDWTGMAQSVFPHATIHSFELNPDVARMLAGRFSNTTNIHVHAYGLAAAEAEVEFFAYSGEASVLSGLRAPLHSHVPHTRKIAKVRTGDAICAEQMIDRIDYLKVDAEGADLDVLKGFDKLLTGHKIRVLQFEHEGGRHLYDFYEYLAPKGYAIGKLYANYVDFRPHQAAMEHFLGPNYIAVLASESELINRLRTGWKWRSVPPVSTS